MTITTDSTEANSVLFVRKSRLRGAPRAHVQRRNHQGSRLSVLFGKIGTTPAKCLGEIERRFNMVPSWAT